MKGWLQKQNSYSLLKMLAIFLLLYKLSSAMVYCYGGRMYLGSYFGGTFIVYLYMLLRSYTPKGRLYFSNYFRAAVGLLLASSVINGLWQLGMIADRVELNLTLLIAIISFVFYFVGSISQYVKSGRNSK